MLSFFATEEVSQNPISTFALSYCDSQNRPEVCTDVYFPVCAFVTDCIDGICTKTISNACEACADPTVVAYGNYICEEKKAVCDPENKPEFCTYIYDPVCSISLDCFGQGNTACYRTLGNSCAACIDDKVDYHLPGECPVSETSDKCELAGKIYCDPNIRNDMCLEIYMPVCAFKTDCNEEVCSKTFGNGCDACRDQTVEYYVDGECLADKHHNAMLERISMTWIMGI